MNTVETMDDWEQIEKDTNARFQKFAKNTDSKVIKSIAKEVKPDKEKEVKCRMAHKIFYESIEMFEEGDLTFNEFIEDLYKTLKQI